MASRMNFSTPQPEEDVVSFSRESPTASSLHLTASGRANVEPVGCVQDAEEEALNCTTDFIDDEMLMEVLRENNVIDISSFIEEEELQVIFEDVKRPRSSHNQKLATNQDQISKLIIANQRLTKEKKALLKEVQDLKLELAQQKSCNLLARHEHSNQVLDVLSTELTCVICSEIAIEAVAIECGHIFCNHCISNWFVQQTILPSCPTCRAVTYKDPIKISKLNSTIASFHALVSQEAQSDRQQLLEDRKAEEKKAQEALAEARARWLALFRSQLQRATNPGGHLPGLNPGVNAGFEGPGQVQPTDFQLGFPIGHAAALPPATPIGFNPNHINIFLPPFFDLQSFLQYLRSDATASQNPAMPTTLPPSVSSTNGQGESAFISQTPAALPRNHPVPEIPIANDEVMDVSSARLQQGPPSASHQFHNRDPRVRPRPY